MTCWIILGLSIATALGTGILLRPSRRETISGLVTGAVVTTLNSVVEWVGATNDIYFVAGPLPVVNTPLPLLLSWIFLGCLFAIVYGKALKAGIAGGAITIVAGILCGWLFDYSAYRFLSVLTLGSGGSALIIALIWIVFIPLTALISRVAPKLPGISRS